MEAVEVVVVVGGVARLGFVRGWCFSSGRKSREGRVADFGIWRVGFERGRLRDGFRVVRWLEGLSGIDSRFGFVEGGSESAFLGGASEGIAGGGASLLLFDGKVGASVLLGATGLFSILSDAGFCKG